MLSVPSISLCGTVGVLVQRFSFTQGRPNSRPMQLMPLTFSAIFTPVTFGPFLALTASPTLASLAALTPLMTLASHPIKNLLATLAPHRRSAAVPTFALLCPTMFPIRGVVGVWLWGHFSPFALFSVERG